MIFAIFWLFDELVKRGLLIYAVLIFIVLFIDYFEEFLEISVGLLKLIFDLAILIVPPLLIFLYIHSVEFDVSTRIREIKNAIFNSNELFVVDNGGYFKKNIRTVPSYDGNLILKVKKPATYKITVSGCDVRRNFFSKDKICSSGTHIKDGKRFFCNKNLYNSYNFQFPTAPMDKAVLIIKKGKESEKILVGQKPTIIRFENNESGEVSLSLNSPNNDKLTGLGWIVDIEKINPNKAE